MLAKAREQYDFHPHFDIYSIGATMRELLRVAGLNNESLLQLINRCENPNPAFRPNPTELAREIVDLRMNNYLRTVFLPKLRL